MSTEQYPAATQAEANIIASADLATKGAQILANAFVPAQTNPTLKERCNRVFNTPIPQEAHQTCHQSLHFSFFFDGTGNNLEADMPTQELSNVAKLFLAHLRDDKAQGRLSFYIPGIGTRFKEINDPGGTTLGLAFGGQGEDRLNWALNQFNEALEDAELLARNPRNKIASIRVAAFGFSRGATLARAFARELQARCLQTQGQWILKNFGYPVQFYFLGLWDTVASVGIPMSVNTTSPAQSKGWVSTTSALQARNATSNGVTSLAFGLPGADPAPGRFDGHGGWAHPLDIPAMVQKCVHMVAAHEIRNSFPLDSCRRGNRYPENTEEAVYPGVHSDVGGGYRPGEGARSMKSDQMLSLLPLRAMHRIAWECGTPLHPISSLPDNKLLKLFAADENSKKELDRLTELWSYYMTKAGFGGVDLGRQINSHMHLYYAWRFYKIRQNRAARTNRVDTKDEAELKRLEAQWREERRALEKQIAPLKKKFDAAHTELTRAQNRRNAAEMQRMEYGTAVDPALQRSVDDAQARADAASDEYLPLKARYDTLPSCDGLLAHNLQTYDDQLMADAEAIRMALLTTPSLRVRPHYRNLLEAYEAEFIRGEGLRDEKIIEFFDTYVHDSLAGFARDATLPSDPRVVYVGGDVKSRHAQGSSSESSAEVA